MHINTIGEQEIWFRYFFNPQFNTEIKDMESPVPHSTNNHTDNTTHTQDTDTDSSLFPLYNHHLNDSYCESLALDIDDDAEQKMEDLLLRLDINPSTDDDINMSTLDEEGYLITINTPRTETIPNPPANWLDSPESNISSPQHTQTKSPEPAIYKESNEQCTPTMGNTHSEPLQETHETTHAKTTHTDDIQPPIHQTDNPQEYLAHMGSPTKRVHTLLSSDTPRSNEQKSPVKTPTKQHKESKHEPTPQAHNYKARTTVQPTNRKNDKNQVNRNEKANKAHTHQTFAPRQDTDFPRNKYTYEELVSQLRILTTKYKLHYEYAEAMKLRVQHREPPQNLLITKHSPFPLPPHFQSHWDKILTNTSNDLCNLIRKHHEEERDILETKINHLTSCLRITATKDQMKQYMQFKLTVDPTTTTQHGPIDDAIQDIYKPHNFEHSTMVHQQDTDTTCTPTEPRTRRPTNTKCGQTYNPTTSTPRQTTQSNIKALDKDANTHNKRPALLGDPPTKRHKQQIQQTIPHQTRRPGLLGERPTNTATYTYNKTNWLSHRNTNTANNTNHPFPHKRVPLMSIKFTKPPTTTPQSHSKNCKRQRPHNPPKNTI